MLVQVFRLGLLLLGKGKLHSQAPQKTTEQSDYSDSDREGYGYRFVC